MYNHIPEVVADDLRPLHHAPAILVVVPRGKVDDDVRTVEQGDNRHGHLHGVAVPAHDRLAGEEVELEGAEEAPGDVPQDTSSPLRRQEPTVEA